MRELESAQSAVKDKGRVPAGRLRATAPAKARSGDTVWVALRPEKIRLSSASELVASMGENSVDGRVESIGYLGDLSIYKVQLDAGFVMQVAVANVVRLVERPISWGDRVRLSWSPDAAVVLTR